MFHVKHKNTKSATLCDYLEYRNANKSPTLTNIVTLYNLNYRKKRSHKNVTPNNIN